ncbi:zinc ribbon domain-containing protein [Paenibacillus donghaensis]|uniref:DZANK-type domain-containing protein n=1 Tax=Paenibacillus donghaensis TaxID=414771 RepID=A0A2Z2KMC5_9BACL|nr:zinc ribbon domain-containing protein [Paenibacillus donghaensis]ASA21221.1 hypothetical protein B9T62_10745 [Paenibacillus donghaensis]
MSVEQNKLGISLNHVKEGLEQRKRKIQNHQEITSLQHKVKEASQQKTKIYLELGKMVHKMIRDGRIQNEELLQMVRPITAQDRLIYETLKQIEQINILLPNHVKCECGTFLPEDQPYCTACGSKNLQYELDTTQSLKICSGCEAEIAQSSVFCPCCGIATMDVMQEGS